MADKSKLRTFVLGGLVGVAAGILLSPRSGKELRGSIANRAGEARERGRETYFEAQERARERLAEARDRPSPGYDTLEDTLSSRPAETRPRLVEPLGEPLGPLAEEPAAEEPVSTPPPLREVSGEAPPGSGGDPEELRRRIREARSRLRERLDGPEDQREV
jgi:gas vesicle protein